MEYENYNIDLEKPELIKSKGTDILGVGLKYKYDTRDRDMNSRKGQYFLYELIDYRDLDGGNFIKSNIDYKGFKSITENQVIGFQSNLRINNGDVPFQRLESLGDHSLLRGYLGSRYIDKNLFAFQVEYRYPIYKKISGVAFGGMGKVYNDKFTLDEMKSSSGLGIRYNLSKEQGVNLRFDYAVGEDGGEFYINIGEAF